MSRKFRSPQVGENITMNGCDARALKIPVRSEEAAEVARWFGLGTKTRRRKRHLKRQRARRISLSPGTITLITGASGAGKSVLLRRLREQHKKLGRRWIDLDAIRFPVAPIVNCFGDQPLHATLLLLNRVGLGEAWSYLRTPAELSEGQRFRLRLAMGLHLVGSIRGGAALCPGVGGTILACDEFAATLDRLTALIVACCLRRAIDALPHVAVVVATSHDDLIAALRPDVMVRCDFGKVEVGGATRHDRG